MINTLVRSLKKRRLSKKEKQDVDVEAQERECRENNPFAHIAQKNTLSSSLINIITPKKRKHAKTPIQRRNGPSNASAMGDLLHTPNTAEHKHMTGWKELENTPKPLNFNTEKMFSPVMHSSSAMQSAKKRTMFSANGKTLTSPAPVEKVPTPMSDESDNTTLKTFHSPLTLHDSPVPSSPQVWSAVKSRASISHANELRLSPRRTPQTAPAKSSRRFTIYDSPVKKSPARMSPRRVLVFDDAASPVSARKRMRTDDMEPSRFDDMMAEDEFCFDNMSNEEKIANVFNLVKNPLDTLMRGMSPRKMVGSPLRTPGTPSTPSMREQYPYCLRVFVGTATDLIDTKVGFKRNPDPYVTLEVGHCRQNSMHITGSRNPSFNHSFSFIVHSTRRPLGLGPDPNNPFGGDDSHRDPELTVKLFDHDNIFAHAFMGKASIELTTLLKQAQISLEGKSEVRSEVVPLSGDGIASGSIQIAYDISQGINFKF